jgi:hypothetical protein
MLLLALTAHAFVASATHFHSLPQLGAGPAQVALQDANGEGNGSPLGSDEKQCLLCRLQRNFVTDLHQAALLINAPAARTPEPEPLHEAEARAGAPRLRQGRAPPAVQS